MLYRRCDRSRQSQLKFCDVRDWPAREGNRKAECADHWTCLYSTGTRTASTHRTVQAYRYVPTGASFISGTVPGTVPRTVPGTVRASLAVVTEQ